MPWSKPREWFDWPSKLAGPVGPERRDGPLGPVGRDGLPKLERREGPVGRRVTLYGPEGPVGRLVGPERPIGRLDGPKLPRERMGLDGLYVLPLIGLASCDALYGPFAKKR